jgi:hypothetical protein
MECAAKYEICINNRDEIIDIVADRLSLQEDIDPFTGEPVEKNKKNNPLGVVCDKYAVGATFNASGPYRVKANHPFLNGWL